MKVPDPLTPILPGQWRGVENIDSTAMQIPTKVVRFTACVAEI